MKLRTWLILIGISIFLIGTGTAALIETQSFSFYRESEIDGYQGIGIHLQRADNESKAWVHINHTANSNIFNIDSNNIENLTIDVEILADLYEDRVLVEYILTYRDFISYGDPIEIYINTTTDILNLTFINLNVIPYQILYNDTIYTNWTYDNGDLNTTLPNGHLKITIMPESQIIPPAITSPPIFIIVIGVGSIGIIYYLRKHTKGTYKGPF